MKTMVKGIEENEVEVEESIEGFDGEQISICDFKQDMMNLVGQALGIELRYKGCLITAKCYDDLEVYEDENKQELIFDDNNGEIPFMTLPMDEVDTIFRGIGFMDEEKWIVRVNGGLEYFIWLEM